MNCVECGESLSEDASYLDLCAECASCDDCGEPMAECECCIGCGLSELYCICDDGDDFGDY